MILMLTWMALAECGRVEPIQDLNCNGVPAEVEGLVDPADEGCADVEYELQDGYYAYQDRGCTVPVHTRDVDGDGLGSTRIRMPGTPDELIILSCDICPEVSDPLQEDTDCDGMGDACDLCPLQVTDICDLDPDGDGVGNACDNCPDTPNPDQLNRDRDRFGDACDLCPDLPTPNNGDEDQDRVGDECDACPFVAEVTDRIASGDFVDPDLCLIEPPSRGCSEPEPGLSGTGSADCRSGGGGSATLGLLVFALFRRRVKART